MGAGGWDAPGYPTPWSPSSLSCRDGPGHRRRPSRRTPQVAAAQPVGQLGGATNQPAEEKAKRPPARELIGAYHQEQLRALLEHVRDGFARLDAGEIDEFASAT